MTTQTTIKYLNKTGCESIKVTLPEIVEQRRLVATIKEFMDSIVLQKIQLEKLQSLKSGLIHDLLTGKVRVTVIQNPTLTPESL